jgi:predicted 3-demethylubiquinone-9 3-methyltransferase (glyoxalase superfamily)
MAGNHQETPRQTITPFLCFNENAEEAVNLYVSMFNNASIERITR